MIILSISIPGVTQLTLEQNKKSEITIPFNFKHWDYLLDNLLVSNFPFRDKAGGVTDGQKLLCEIGPGTLLRTEKYLIGQIDNF